MFVDGKEYNLDELLSFQLLKDVLLALNKQQKDLNNIVINLENEIKIKDKRIKDLEDKADSYDKKFKAIENHFNDLKLPAQSPKSHASPKSKQEETQAVHKEDPKEDKKSFAGSSKTGGKEEKKSEKTTEEKRDEKEEKKEEIKQEKADDEKKESDNKDDQSEKNNEHKSTHSQKEKEEKDEEANQEEEKKETEEGKKTERKEEEELPIRPLQTDEGFSKKEENESKRVETQNDDSALLKELGSKDSGRRVSTEMITILFKKIKENQDRIEALEKASKSHQTTGQFLKNDSSVLKKKIQNVEDYAKQNVADLAKANNDISSQIAEINEVLDQMRPKVMDFQVFDLFKDNGDGNIDAYKAMLTLLENKVFKKFSLVDERNKNLQNDLLNLKNFGIENKNKVDGCNLTLSGLKEEFEKYKESQNYINTKVTADTENLDKKIGEAQNELTNEIEKNKALFEKELKDLRDELIEKMNNISDELGNQNTQANAGSGDQEVDDKKIKALTRKINDLEKSYRNFSSTLPISDIQKKISDLENDMKKRLLHGDLKELYDFHLQDLDSMHDLKDNINLVYDDNRKVAQDLANIGRKVESIGASVALMQAIPRGGAGKQQSIDISKFIDHAKFMESTKSLQSELERLRKEDEELKRNIEDVSEKLKNMADKSEVKDAENNLTQIIQDFKVTINKKYPDKIELGKMIKVLEAKITQLHEDHKREAGENWLLAKRPLGYKCASCEATLDNLNTKNDYLPWNRYPVREEKSYRMGSGFSHMLQMMSTEMVKNYDKDFSSDNEEGKKRSFSGIRKNLVKSGKVTLPKVKIAKKPINLIDEVLSLSDGENYSDDDKNKRVPTSPKIVKAWKKKK